MANNRHATSIRWIASIAVITVIVIAVLIVVLYDYFTYEKERQVLEQSLKPPSGNLDSLLAYEDDMLNSYGLVIDSTTTSYRIPIDSAMKIIAETFSD